MGKKSPDVLGVMEMKADYLLRLDRKTEAEEAYGALLARNQEYSTYYDGFVKAKGLEDGPAAELKKVYLELSEKYPKADFPRRRPLDFLQGEEFREAADTYLQKMLRKGVPSTFANIKHLYSDQAKKKAVEELVEGYAAGKAKTQANGSAEGKKDHFEWSVLYFLAQHYNYKLSRDLTKAMEYSEKCINLDSKSVDFHAVKARTFKHQGDSVKAAESMEQARALDERDRAINTKCSKYQLQNDQNELALETASKFTQNKTAGGPLGDLIDMQCVWFLTEDGQSYLRQRKLGLALKRFHQLLNVFDIWQDDQFDFHNFSLRKGMIRAYVDMLRWEDHLRDHPYYSRMAVSACQAYIMLSDNPDLAHGPIMDGVNADGEVSAADRKKALKKAKREQEKMEKAEADKKAAMKAAKPTPKSEEADGKKEDTDPFGKQLVETKEPLKDAMKFLGPLMEFCPEVVDAQVVGFEIYMRRKKYLLAAKCLMQLKALDSKHESLGKFSERLKKVTTDKPEGLDSQVGDLLSEQMKVLSI